MPIKINLLAEAQAAEELRRHDPVKRFTFIGVSLVLVFFVWFGMAKINCKLAGERLEGVQTAIDAHASEYANVVSNMTKINVAKTKLSALDKLQSARFLQGNLLNALQHISVEGVQLTQLRVDQSYFETPGTPAKNGTAGRPASVKERIVVTLEAKDSSVNPGGQVNVFKQAILNQDYFKTMLDKTNGVQLTRLDTSQTDSNGKPYALFALECRFPEISR